MAEITIYNSQKSRLETINFEFTDKNTTWFDDSVNDQDVHMIVDVFGGLLIRQYGYNYPVWIDGVSRAQIEYSPRKAFKLKGSYTKSS
jgi:hypothetical protein